MIKFLVDTTVTGDRFPAGSISNFGTVIERQLINQGVAILCPLPVLIAQSYAGWTRSSANAAGDATYQTLTSVVVPGGTMGLNSKLEIVEDWDIPNSASTKTMGIDVGGSNVSALALGTGQVGFKGMHEFQNLNSLTSQKTANAISYALFATNARLATSIDTTVDFNVDFKCKWSAATSSESIVLLGYSVWHFPGS